MSIINYQLIILGTTTLLLWIINMFRAGAYACVGRLVHQCMQTDAHQACYARAALPPVSIIIPACNQCQQLQRHLPIILQQEYPQPFEVWVIDVASTDDTRQWLEQMEERYQHLHHTYTLPGARDISVERLALTLGFKATTHDWVLLTRPDCCPDGNEWLLHMALTTTLSDALQIVVGHTRYWHPTGWSGMVIRFRRMWNLIHHLPRQQRGRVYTAEGTNLMYRRSLFMSHQGLGSHSLLRHGAVEIMVNHHSTALNTAVCLHPDAAMLQDVPTSRRQRYRDRLIYMQSRRQFHHRWWYGMRRLMSHVLLCKYYMATIICIGWLAWMGLYPYISIPLILCIIHLVWQGNAFHHSLLRLGERPMYAGLPWLQMMLPWWDLTLWFRHMVSKKKQYRKPFV